MSIRLFKIPVICFLFVVSFLAGPLWAAAPARGLVVLKVGKVELIRDGKTSSLPSGSLVEAGDRFKIYPKAKVALQFSSGMICQAQAGSELELVSLQADGPGTSAVLKLHRGSLDASVESKKKNRMNIQTPAALASVRGTRFRVEADRKETKVLVEKGEVAVSDPDGNKEQNIKGGFKAVVTKGRIRKAILKDAERRRLQASRQIEFLRKSNFREEIKGKLNRIKSDFNKSMEKKRQDLRKKFGR